MFGGFCLLFLAMLFFPFRVWLFVFLDASLLVSFVCDRIFLIEFCLVFGLGSFCLESLILAQDERWRRA